MDVVLDATDDRGVTHDSQGEGCETDGGGRCRPKDA